MCLHDLLWGETVFTVFYVLLVFVYHLAEAGIDPTATPTSILFPAVVPDPPSLITVIPPKYSQKMTNSFPPKREVPQLPHVCKGPGKGKWEGGEAGMALRRKVKRPGPRWSKAGLWPKLRVMGTLLKLLAEKCYFLAYVWWYHTGCSTKNGDARRDQRPKQWIHLEASTVIQVRGWWLSLVPSAYRVACCTYSLECPTDNMRSLNPEWDCFPLPHVMSLVSMAEALPSGLFQPRRLLGPTPSLTSR